MNPKQLIAIILVPLLLLIGYLIFSRATPALPAGTLTLTAIDVGQGDSLLLRTPGGRNVLIDGGGHSDSVSVDSASDVGEKIVVPFLRHEGIDHLDMIVVTHPHGDHVGGLFAVMRDLKVDRVLDGTVLPCDTEAYRRFIDEAAAKRVVRSRATRGMRIDMGDGVTIDVLNPPANGNEYGIEPNNDTVNNYSTVLRVTYGKTHLMLDGDAQTEAEDSMIAAFPGKLQADVLKCGHHGAHNATSDEWLEAVHPGIALISCGAHNHYGHPSPETMARLAQANVTPYITARDGAITVSDDGEHISVETMRERSGGK